MAQPSAFVHRLRAMSEGEGRADPYQVLRNRDFLLYLIGRFIASFGQQMVTVAVGWELYERTHKPLALGLVGLTQMVPMIGLTLPAGHFADNHNRKRIIITGMMVMSLASVGLAISSYLAAPVGWIYACLFVGGCARTFLWPAGHFADNHNRKRIIITGMMVMSLASVGLAKLITII